MTCPKYSTLNEPSSSNLELSGNRKSDIVASTFFVDSTPAVKLIKICNSNQLLPKGYQPSQYDVVCGRGKGHYNQPGNRNFRNILHRRLPEYKKLRSRADKTIFLSTIVEAIRCQNNGHANFIRRFKSTDWTVLTDEEAREKVGHAIREMMLPRYKVKVIPESKPISRNRVMPFEFTYVPTSSCIQASYGFQQEGVSTSDYDPYEPLPITWEPLIGSDLPIEFVSLLKTTFAL
jgi:hypothetical protein